MEAGIDPVQESVTHKVGTQLHEYGNILHTICSIAAHTKCSREQNIIHHLAQTILSNIEITLLHYTNTHMDSHIYIDVLQTTLHKKLLQNHAHLWHSLKFPHPTPIRTYILKYLINLQKFVEFINPFLHNNLSSRENFLRSHKQAKPSFFSQVTTHTSATIDPYLIALSKNYYFPISTAAMDDNMEDDTSPGTSTRNSESSNTPPPSPKRVTVEDSIETISEIISEYEDDELPVQTQLSQHNQTAIQQSIQTKASSFTHRFSIYKRNGIPAAQLKTPNQIALFQSFCRCLKSIDNQLRILPIRNDHNIHPLSTSDQITHIDEIGITNYFKAYKRTQRTLSGDFHIGTSLTFDELKNHKNLSTWFHLNGYNITISGCQSSDMVRIGFLSRVRGFTYRDDMHNFIMASEHWKQSNFHFRLYFDMFSAGSKGKNTYVLMIDVDRPNIEKATTYFQQHFDGDKQNSPNKIAYIFFPLYRKTYTEDERIAIIRDNEHHTENDSVVGIHGLQNLNTIVQMVQGIRITIRHLLLAIPCQGTTNGKLFHQIERQANNEWQLCSFHTIDTTKISIRLANLETLIKRYIRTEDHKNLFLDPSKPLKFSGQAAPIKKGRPKLPILEIPEETMKYTTQALTKLFTPAPKRSANPHIIEQSTTNESPQVNYNLNISPTSDKDSNETAQPNITPPTDVHAKIQSVEMDIKNQNSRLTRLEDICSQLASSTQNLTTQLISMNQNMNDKLGAMANSIDQLYQSPSGRTTKFQKSHHHYDDELPLQL